MCHCGDDFCDMRPDARAWANEQLAAGTVNIRHKVIEKFGKEAVDFNWLPAESEKK